MNLEAIAQVLVVIACAADAYTTDSFIKRGGTEGWAKRIVGERPSALVCWLAFFAVPVALFALVLRADLPIAVPVAIGYAVVKAWVSYRNHRLRR